MGERGGSGGGPAPALPQPREGGAHDGHGAEQVDGHDPLPDPGVDVLEAAGRGRVESKAGWPEWDRLRGRAVANVSPTAAGGGVAEMLRVLAGLARGYGIDVRWAVIAGSPVMKVLLFGSAINLNLRGLDAAIADQANTAGASFLPDRREQGAPLALRGEAVTQDGFRLAPLRSVRTFVDTSL